MMKQKVLITGGSGLLALNWCISISDRYDVTLGLYDRVINLKGINSQFIMLDKPGSLHEILSILSPQIIIHTAGMTNVELCEKNPLEAQRVNSDLSFNVAQVCDTLGIKLVHISTDHLFSGNYALVDENHPIDPQNIYGMTKAEAEKKVLSVCPSALVIRTNFYAWGPGYRSSFSDVIINSLRRREELHLFHDVYYTPILAETLAHTVHELIDKHAEGIYNVVANERISKYEFGLRLAKKFGLSQNLIKPMRMVEKKGLVRRPLDLSLSGKKTCEKLGRTIGNINDDIDRLYIQENFQTIKEIKEL